MIGDFLRQVIDETTPLRRDIEAAVATVRSVMRLINVEQIEANLRAMSSLIDRNYDQDALDLRAAYHDEKAKRES